jgi:hypothetical protein
MGRTADRSWTETEGRREGAPPKAAQQLWGDFFGGKFFTPRLQIWDYNPLVIVKIKPTFQPQNKENKHQEVGLILKNMRALQTLNLHPCCKYIFSDF